MAFIMKCPSCQSALRIKEEYAGKQLKCPRCTHVMSIPRAKPKEEEEEALLLVAIQASKRKRGPAARSEGGHRGRRTTTAGPLRKRRHEEDEEEEDRDDRRPASVQPFPATWPTLPAPVAGPTGRQEGSLDALGQFLRSGHVQPRALPRLRLRL